MEMTAQPEEISTHGSPAPEPGSNWRERYRVRISFIFALLFIWRAQPRSVTFLAIGLLVSLAGIFLRQWAAGCVKKMDEVAQTGPYALVRHPLYLGSFLAGLGMLIASTVLTPAVSKPFLDRTLFFWTFFWLLIDAIYRPKIANEEKNLRAKFGSAYEDYQKRVPQIWPRQLKKESFDFSTFSWDLWKKNREYGSLLGAAVIYAVLIARFFYR